MVPGWRGVDAPVPEALCAALASAHARGCRIISICSGVFVLAAAGLLNGRRGDNPLALHRGAAVPFSADPVVEDVLYVGDALLMTSAGSAAGIDLCLHLVREDFGSEAANVVARRPGRLSPSRRRSGAAGPAPGSPQPGEPAPRSAV